MTNQADNLADMARVLLDMARLFEGIERQLHAIEARLARLERERGKPFAFVAPADGEMIRMEALRHLLEDEDG